MPFPALGKKKKESPEGRCVQHYYRPQAGECSVCASPLCQDCLPMCKECIEHPMDPEEAARARARKKGRLAKKPVLKKSKKGAPKPKQGPNKLLTKFELDASQRDIAIGVAAAVLGPIFVILLILTLLGKNPFGVVKPVVPAETRAKQVKVFVGAAVNRIELYRQKNGKLPESLKEIGITDPKAWKYQIISADQYLVEVTLDGQSFTFNSNQDYRTVFPGMTVSAPKKKGP